MKIKIEVDTELKEQEVIIRCPAIDENVLKVQEAITRSASQVDKMVLNKKETEYYIPMQSLLFFETSDNMVSAHTADDIFTTGYKLYELEEMLPGNFMRVSKSTIINVNHIYSITRNLTASSVVQFSGTHKQVFVSRNYYKALMCRMEEKRYK